MEGNRRDKKCQRGWKETLASTYHCQKEDYGSKHEVEVDFWFCGDNIE